MEKLSYIKSILLGIAQGLTGLMPLSDTGHLLILEKMSGIALSQDELAAFMLALRAGLVLAILVCCVRTILGMLAHPFKSELKWALLSALPVLGLSLLIKAKGWDDTLSKSASVLLPFAFLFTGVVIFLSQGIGKNRRLARTSHDKPRFTDALSVGLMQCLSVFTGVSLSGMSISGSLTGGLKAGKTADFAFAALLPALLALYLPDGIRLMNSGTLKNAVASNGYMLLSGLLAAALLGIFAIKLTQFLIRKEKLRWFSIYLALAAIVTIISGVAGK